MGKSFRKNHFRNCVICEKSFFAHSMKTRFCSSSCYGLTLIKDKIIKPKKVKIYKRVDISCENCKCIFTVILARKDRARFCSKKCQGKFFCGIKSCHYKMDRSSLMRNNERNDSAYKVWRMNVWARDNFKCKIVDSNCNGKIEAHHILSWKLYPELRYEINNGITLCHAHHPRKRLEEKILIPKFMELVSKVKIIN